MEPVSITLSWVSVTSLSCSPKVATRVRHSKSHFRRGSGAHCVAPSRTFAAIRSVETGGLPPALSSSSRAGRLTCNAGRPVPLAWWIEHGPTNARGSERPRRSNWKHGCYSAEVKRVRREARRPYRSVRQLIARRRSRPDQLDVRQGGLPISSGLRDGVAMGARDERRSVHRRRSDNMRTNPANRKRPVGRLVAKHVRIPVCSGFTLQGRPLALWKSRNAWPAFRLP